MALGLKKLFSSEDDKNCVEDEFYTNVIEEERNGKMVLIEPRAFSEAQGIADHLKSRRTVVVNLKRVTSDQAKRIVDFLSGCIYAIGGDLQKIGGGIFLCTPKMVQVEGEISADDKKGSHNNDDIDVEL